jgi:hypothetical protein
MRDLSPPSTKTPLTEPDEKTLNHIWQRWFSDLYAYLSRRQAVDTASSAAADTGLAVHIAKTGTAVHGLGTASTHSVSDFDLTGAAAAVAADLAEFENYAVIELRNRAIVYDPVPAVDTLLIKDATSDLKSYRPLVVGDYLVVSEDLGTVTLSVDGELGETVAVSADDTTPNYLENKILAGTNISVTKENPAGNEDLKIAVTGQGAANGLATLGADSKLTSSQIPDISVVDYLGSVASQVAMLALVGQKGDWCTRSDLGTNWIITGDDPTQLASWTQLSYPPTTVHALGSATHSADTIANIQTKVSDGSLITTKAGEISALTAKTVPLPADLVMIESVADTNAKRKSTIAQILGNETDPVFLARAVTTQHYTGFPNRTDSTATFTDGTRKFALSGAFDIYVNGSKYTPTGAGQLEITIANTTGQHWVWYTISGGNPVLNESITAPGFNVCLVAVVYWNATAAKSYLSDERHWMGRDRFWHEWAHETIGPRYGNGFTGAFTNTTFSITAGEFYDEDIELKTLAPATTCDMAYRSAVLLWLYDVANVNPYKLNGSAMRYDNAGTLTDVPTGKYVAMFVFATNKIAQPFLVVMGQRIDNNIADCRSNALPENLSLGTFLTAEYKLLYRLIFHQAGANPTYDEATDYRTISGTIAGTLALSNHAALTNLDYSTANHTGFITKAGAEIASVTVKSTPVRADLLLIEDSAATNAKKQVTIGNLVPWLYGTGAPPSPVGLVDGTLYFRYTA